MPRRPLPFVRHRTANQIRSKYRAWRHPIEKSYWATIAYGSLVFVGDIGNPPASLSYDSGGTSQSSRSRFCTCIKTNRAVRGLDIEPIINFVSVLLGIFHSLLAIPNAAL